MSAALVVAAVILVALVVYTLTAGADFGGGVWDLLARGRTAAAEHRLIDRAIAPIWEANHVWLILVVVLLFVCFPAAYAGISTVLHIPLTVMLVGVVLRGSAFTFAAYDPMPGGGARRFRRLFAISSLLTPVALGVVLGAVSTAVEVDPRTGRVVGDFVSAWLEPYPFAVGLFVLALFAYLAAVYLIHEADDEALRVIFRRRAQVSGVLTGGAALLAFLVAREGAPRIHEGLVSAAWSTPLHLVTGAAALVALWALHRRRDHLARAAAMLQAALIVVGWGLAQYPYLAVPGYTIEGAAAPEGVLWPVLIALAAGSVLLLPALVYLVRVFKARPVRGDG
ncbi:MAG: cytochrome d ubiquinol oxidase subunit II [Nannocystaceae bacterium]